MPVYQLDAWSPYYHDSSRSEIRVRNNLKYENRESDKNHTNYIEFRKEWVIDFGDIQELWYIGREMVFRVDVGYFQGYKRFHVGIYPIKK